MKIPLRHVLVVSAVPLATLLLLLLPDHLPVSPAEMVRTAPGVLRVPTEEFPALLKFVWVRNRLKGLPGAPECLVL